jgi:hypothetical protein
MTTTPTLWSAAVQINETDLGANNNNSQSASKLVAIGGGRFVVVWEDDTSELTGFEPNDIAGRIVGPTGVPEDDDFVASWTYFDFDQSQADVMALPGGGFAVAYKSADAAGLGDGENITVDIFDSAGNPVSSDDFRQFTGDRSPSKASCANSTTSLSCPVCAILPRSASRPTRSPG